MACSLRLVEGFGLLALLLVRVPFKLCGLCQCFGCFGFFRDVWCRLRGCLIW